MAPRNSRSNAAVTAVEGELGLEERSEPEIDLPPLQSDGGSGDGETVDLSPEVQNHLQAVPLPPPRPSKEDLKEQKEFEKAARAQMSPSMKRLGPLGNKLPGAEHVKVYRRNNKGAVEFIGNYALRDIPGSQTFEEFLAANVVPTYGPGEYPIKGINAQGFEIDGGSYNFAAPPVTPKVAQEPMLDVIKTLLDRQNQAPVAREPRPAAVDPIESMKKLDELRAQLSSGSEGGIASMTNLMAVMMQMSAQQTQQMVSMIAEGSARSEERILRILEGGNKGGISELMPIILLVFKMFMEKKEEAPQPLPRMPDPVDPIQQLKAMAETIALLQPKRENDDVFLKMLLSDRMGPRDMLELVKNMGGGGGGGGMKESLDQVGAILGLAQQLRQAQEPGASAGFWDAAHALLSNKGFGSGLADGLRALSSGRQRAAAQAPAPSVHVSQLPQQPERSALPAPSASAPSVPPKAPEQQAAPRPPKPDHRPQVPQEIVEPINKIVLAIDQAERVNAVLDLVFFLGGYPDWQDYAQRIVKSVMDGNKTLAMQYIKNLFEGLITLKLFDAAPAKVAYEAFEERFADLQTLMQNKLQELQAAQGPTTDSDDDADGDDDSDDDDDGDDGDDESPEDPTTGTGSGEPTP